MTTTPTTHPLAATPDGTQLVFTGRITTVDPRITRQENPWAVITMTTQHGELPVEVLPLHYLQHRELLVVGATITATVRVSQYGGTPTVCAFGIQAADGGR
jgi:DNA polymerase III alpha subunit